MEKCDTGVQQSGFSGFLNPFLFNNMDKALERIIKAVNERQKIVIYGYYDLDGITAVSLLVLVLKYLNADVEYFISDSIGDSYGINSDVVKNHIKFLGASLMITVGCGTESYSEVELCKELGIDVIITDYHSVNDIVPDSIIINPNLKNCSYPFKELSAVGVAYKLAQAISMYYHMKSIGKYLDMVMLGTISKCKFLCDENKTIVDYGIRQLSCTHNYGLRALMKVHRITMTGEDMDIESAFRLASSIMNSGNSRRRADNARIAVELFTTSNMDRAEQIAKYLKNETNKHSHNNTFKIMPT